MFERKNTLMISRPLFAIFLVFLSTACKENTQTPDLGKIEYALNNASEIDIGFKVRLLEGANANKVKDSTLIKPNEELVIIKSQTSQEPNTLIKVIEVWDKDFKTKYKEINLDEYVKAADRYTLTIVLPYKNTADITKFNTSVHIYLNENLMFGFYPKVDYPRTTYFFSTPNYFKELTKIQTPNSIPNADFVMVNVFGSSMIGYNSNVYADKTLFIKSNDGGSTWQPFFEFGFSTSDDAFVATDFINVNTGWMFNYKIVFNGQFANTYATDVYKFNSGNIFKLSTINNYNVTACKFFDENTGYILANISNDVIPADTRVTYILKTIDGGITWSTPVLISNSYSSSKFFKLDSGKIIVFFNPWQSLAQDYIVSTDDGQTWHSESAPGTHGIRDVYFLENGTGYLKTGTSGSWSSQNIGDVFKTTNGGNTWTKVKDTISGSTIWFYDDNIGYLQDLMYGKGQILYVTKDGGLTWREVLYPYNYVIN